MGGAANRKYLEGTGHEFNGTTQHPDTDDKKQDADRHAADLPLTRNQARAQQ